MRDMAYVFAEEFARLGYTRDQLLWLFKNPFYGGAHGAYRSLGERETLSIIDECLNIWGSIKVTVQDVQNVQNVQPPPVFSPASEGGGRTGGSNLRNGLNGAQRLNDLNVLNRKCEERGDE
jgi:hypothetical protein